MDWFFVFKIEHGEVIRVCPPSDPALREPRFARADRPQTGSGSAAASRHSGSAEAVDDPITLAAEDQLRAYFMHKLSEAKKNGEPAVNLGE